MTTFFYVIGGLLVLGAVLIAARWPDDWVAWVLGGLFGVGGTIVCICNRR